MSHDRDLKDVILDKAGEIVLAAQVADLEMRTASIRAQGGAAISALLVSAVSARLVFEQRAEGQFRVLGLFAESKAMANRIRLNFAMAPSRDQDISAFPGSVVWIAPPFVVARPGSSRRVVLKLTDGSTATIRPDATLSWQRADEEPSTSAGKTKLEACRWHDLFATVHHWRGSADRGSVYPYSLEGDAQAHLLGMLRPVEKSYDQLAESASFRVANPGDAREQRARSLEQTLREENPALVEGGMRLTEYFIRARVAVDKDGTIIEDPDQIGKDDQQQIDVEASLNIAKNRLELRFHPWDLLTEGGEYEEFVNLIESNMPDQLATADWEDSPKIPKQNRLNLFRKFVEQAVLAGFVIARLDLETHQDKKRNYAVFMRGGGNWIIAHARVKVRKRFAQSDESKISKVIPLVWLLNGQYGKGKRDLFEGGSTLRAWKRLKSYRDRMMKLLLSWQEGVTGPAL